MRLVFLLVCKNCEALLILQHAAYFWAIVRNSFIEVCERFTLCGERCEMFWVILWMASKIHEKLALTLIKSGIIVSFNIFTQIYRQKLSWIIFCLNHLLPSDLQFAPISLKIHEQRNWHCKLVLWKCIVSWLFKQIKRILPLAIRPSTEIFLHIIISNDVNNKC